MSIPIGTDIGYTGDVVVIAPTAPPSTGTGAGSGNASQTRGAVGQATTNKGAKVGAAVRHYMPRLAAVLGMEV
jgi:hypothetical protein